MILPDVNVFVSALHAGSPFHGRTKALLESALVGSEGVALWDVSLVAVYRLLTNPKLESALSDPKDVLAAIRRLRSAPAAVLVDAGVRFWDIYSHIAIEADVRGPVASDAMLAALALEHGCRIATFDRHFSRFPGLDWFAP